ncbi:MAG: hypothetical protein A3H25_16340 [Sphingomonadales bacterium RIFCSPLOWO2_12_FULL_63_15]|jgi:hypothetical protein|nr:MAG: hypothetical protein A3H25_16340 [Sphingomonadales bacterium RIFCSPLOWO2_12_FULL_63_15]
MADGAGVELRPGRQAVADGTRAQQRKARKDSWTRAQEREFLEVLATTCNVSEAARVAGVRRAGAYERRQRDARFAADWDRAIDIGYAEIEAMLMREVLFGSESEEIVLDGEGAVKSRKVKRGRDLKLALQLLIRHRDKVAAYRAAAGVQRPDSPDAVARLRRAMDEIARKRAATGT